MVRSAVEPFKMVLKIPESAEENKVLQVEENDSLAFWLDEEEKIDVKCNEHKYHLEFFCLGMILSSSVECSLISCKKCLYYKHNGHRFIPLYIVHEKAETAKTKMTSAKSTLENELKNIQRKREIQKQKIETAFNQLMTVIEDKKQSILMHFLSKFSKAEERIREGFRN